MTGPELLSILADASVREQVQRALGLPTDRVADRLEELAVAQARTDASVKELAVAQARTDASLGELSAEVKELAAAQARTEAAVEELAVVSKQTRQAVGALSDNVGFGLEELAALVLPEVLLQRRQVEVSGFERRLLSTEEGAEEVDLYAEGLRQGTKVAVVGEVKSRICRREVERFARRVERISEKLGMPVVPLMFGFVVHPSAIEPARAADVLVVASRPSSVAA